MPFVSSNVEIVWMKTFDVVYLLLQLSAIRKRLEQEVVSDVFPLDKYY